MIADIASSSTSSFIGGLAVVVLVGLGGWLFRWLKKELRPLRRVAIIEARQESMMRTQKLVVDAVSTLTANGGSSLRDSIDRNEVMTAEILKAVET